MYTVRVEQEIDSGHQLKLPYPSKCNRKHGHRWKVIVTLRGELNELGMVVDFTHVKGVLKRYDHVFFEFAPPSEPGGVRKPFSFSRLEDDSTWDGLILVPFQPTAENIAKFFFDEVKDMLEEGYEYSKDAEILDFIVEMDAAENDSTPASPSWFEAFHFAVREKLKERSGVVHYRNFVEVASVELWETPSGSVIYAPTN